MRERRTSLKRFLQVTGQRNIERSSCSRFCFEPDATSGGFYDAFYHCQTKTHAPGLSREIRNKDLFQHIIRNTASIVGNGNEEFVFFALKLHKNFSGSVFREI